MDCAGNEQEGGKHVTTMPCSKSWAMLADAPAMRVSVSAAPHEAGVPGESSQAPSCTRHCWVPAAVHSVLRGMGSMFDHEAVTETFALTHLVQGFLEAISRLLEELQGLGSFGSQEALPPPERM